MSAMKYFLGLMFLGSLIACNPDVHISTSATTEATVDEVTKDYKKPDPAVKRTGNHLVFLDGTKSTGEVLLDAEHEDTTLVHTQKADITVHQKWEAVPGGTHIEQYISIHLDWWNEANVPAFQLSMQAALDNDALRLSLAHAKAAGHE